MRQLSAEKLRELIEVHEPPCVSLYQPTHRSHPENRQDPIHYRNLLGKLETLLGERYPLRQVRSIVEKFQPLARDEQFWNYRTDGLAIFSSPERFELYEMQRPVRELLVVADSFHTKPLIRILQSADRFQVLCLNRAEARLFEGNRDSLSSLEIVDFPTTAAAALASEKEPTEPRRVVGAYGAAGGEGGGAVYHGYGSPREEADADMERFFREIDRGVLEYHSRPSGLPLMLAALPEYHEPFRKLSRNPNLINEGIQVNPDSLEIDRLRKLAWERVEPRYLARLERLKDSFHAARARHQGTADLSDAAVATIAGRISTLLIEADRVIPGTIDRTSGAIRSAASGAEHVDDMLDDLSELVLAAGGEVVIVPKERMPTDSGLAAIYRF